MKKKREKLNLEKGSGNLRQERSPDEAERTAFGRLHAAAHEASQRRMVAVYCLMSVMMTGLIYRIYHIGESDYIAMAAAGQGGYNLRIADTRGMIYDREMRPLVNDSYEYVAAVLPSPQAASALLAAVPEEERAPLMDKLSETAPFAMTVPDNNIYAKGVDIFRIPSRYGGYQYAPHIIGYLGGDGVSGVAGIELGYDEELKKAGGSVSCSYRVDAAGHLMSRETVSISRKNEQPVAGLSLTLDRDIQALVQEALTAGCEKGAAVVMEADTGEILAMASIPSFDANNVAASLEDPAAPFVSRAVSGYNIGSVFKLAVSAAALERGISEYREYECMGYVDVDGVIFRCNNNAVHGASDMQRALNVSCNTYFITLAQELGPEYLLGFCRNLGFASAAPLAAGVRTQPGNLPELSELKNPAALANMGFGQGSSLATPLQMTSVTAAIANGGFEAAPELVRGFTSDGAGILDVREPYAKNRILSERTASIMRRLMTGVVTDGSGRTARPLTGGAGGKTSSAQTGQFVNGKEIVHAWFAGFYPADDPEYSIVAFVEGGESGERAAAPIFKNIADGIARMR